MDAVTTATELKRAKRSGFRPSRRTLLVVAIAMTVAVAGGLWITAAPSSQSTDDAYVAADATSVAPKVRGLVAAVLVGDNQTVRAGEPLVRIDPEEFAAKVAQARAAIADAEAGVASARAALISLDAEQRLATAEVAAARTAIRSADAEFDSGRDRPPPLRRAGRQRRSRPA